MDFVKKSNHFRPLGWAIGGLFFAKSWLYHILIVTMPVSLNLREMSHVLNTDRLIRFGDFYQLSSMPVYMSVYGVGYNLLATPLSLLIGTSLLSHRLTSMAFLLASCVLIYKFCSRRGVDRLVCFWGAVLFYSIQCTSYSLAASPDMPGLFFMLLAFSVVDLGDFRISRLGLVLVFGGFSLLIKPYFVFVLPCVALAVFLNDSKIKGIILLFLSIVISIGFVVASSHFFPVSGSLFDLSFQYKSRFLSFFIGQWKWFSIYHAGLFVCLGGLIFEGYRRRRESILVNMKGFFQFQPLSAPLFRQSIDTLLIAEISALFVLLYSLSWHGGAFLIYLLHLLSPFLLVTILSGLSKSQIGPRLLLVGISLNVLSLIWLSPKKPTYNHDYYEQIEAVIADPSVSVLVPPHFNHLLFKYGRDVYDNGQTEYALGYFGKIMKGADSSGYREKSLGFVNELNQMISDCQFDIIVMERSSFPLLDRGLLQQKYQMSENRFYAPFYYGAFRNPLRYGKSITEFTLWTPIAVCE